LAIISGGDRVSLLAGYFERSYPECACSWTTVCILYCIISKFSRRGGGGERGGVLRRIFQPRKEGSYRRKLHNGELYNLYFLPKNIWVNESRRMRLAEHVTRMRRTRNVYNVLVGNQEGKRRFGRARCRWEDDITEIVTEI
jgi:hypothetical protein